MRELYKVMLWHVRAQLQWVVVPLALPEGRLLVAGVHLALTFCVTCVAMLPSEGSTWKPTSARTLERDPTNAPIVNTSVMI